MQILSKKGPALSLSKGFTLIELLVVVAIIGILSSVVMVSLNSARAKANAAKATGDASQVMTAIEMASADGCTTAATIVSGSPITFCTVSYLQRAPTQPTGWTYSWAGLGQSVTPGSAYTLTATGPNGTFTCTSGSCACTTGDCTK